MYLWFKKIYLYIFLLAFGIFVLIRAPADPDFGWHYKYGEYIYNHHALLKENTFSYTFTEYKWANSYWLSELILYVLYKKTGAFGLTLTLSLILSFMATWMLKNVEMTKAGKFITLTTFFAFIGTFYTTVRPLYFSTLFMFILIWILIYAKRLVKFLPLMFLFWANMHADFTLGLFVFGVFTLENVFSLYINNSRFQKISWNKIKKSVILGLPFLVSIFATIINPFGIELWKTLFKETHYFQFNNISEWLPLPLEKAGFISTLAIFATSGIILAASWQVKKHFGWWYFFINLFFFALSIRSVYFYRVLIITGIIGAGDFWGFSSTFIFNSLAMEIRKNLKLVFLVLAFLLFTAAVQSFITILPEIVDAKIMAQKHKYPYEAIEFIKERCQQKQSECLEGNMLNNYNWGGYLIWQLPEYKTFIDGRMTSWREKGTSAEGSSVFEDYIKVSRKPKENEVLLNKYINDFDIRWGLDKKDSKLLEYLTTKGWEVVFDNKISTVIYRTEK